jgi:hypothetical protein
VNFASDCAATPTIFTDWMPRPFISAGKYIAYTHYLITETFDIIKIARRTVATLFAWLAYARLIPSPNL